MLMMTPEAADLAEKRQRETIEWLEGRFDLKPLPRPVVCRLKLGEPGSQRKVG